MNWEKDVAQNCKLSFNGMAFQSSNLIPDIYNLNKEQVVAIFRKQ